MRPDRAWFDTDKILAGGKWIAAGGGATLDVTNPSDGSTLCAIARGTAEDIDRAVMAAQQARDGEWGRLTAAERGRLMLRLAQLVRERAEDLAVIEAQDVGKPLKQARADTVALAR